MEYTNYTEINWNEFLNVNESLLGIEKFVQNLLENVTSEELIRNILHYKSQLILNEVILKVVLTTDNLKNRISVHTLLKILSSDVELYNTISQKKAFWKNIYLFFHPYVIFPSKEKFSQEEPSLMQKLSIRKEYHIYKRDEDIKYPISSMMTEQSKTYSIGTLNIDYEIKKIAIIDNAIFVLNDRKQIIEYFIPSQMKEKTKKDDSLEDEQDFKEKSEIQRKINLDNSKLIHQNSRVIFENVKEMLNFETQDTSSGEIIDLEEDDEEEETYEDESTDICIAVLTYSGELFFHRMISNISFTLKFDVEVMKSRFDIDITKILNIQNCEESRYAIAIEFEDHSIYMIDVINLFKTIVEKPFIVTEDGEFSDDENSPSFKERYSDILDNNAFISTSITETIPISFFWIDDEDEEELEGDIGFKPISKIVERKEFEEEKDLSFEQKTHRKSLRLFTSYCKNYTSTITFFFDRPEKESVLNVSIHNKELREYHPNFDFDSRDDYLESFQIDSVVLSHVQHLSIHVSSNVSIGQESLILSPASYLQIKCDNEFYWLNVEQCKMFNLNAIPSLPINVNIPFDDQINLQEDEEVNDQDEIIEEQVIENLEILEHSAQNVLRFNSHILREESTNVSNPDHLMIDNIRRSELVQLKLPDNLKFKDIFYLRNSPLYALTTDKKFLINNDRVNTPMIMNSDGGMGDIDIIFRNVSRIIFYNNYIAKTHFIFRVCENEFIPVPHQHYLMYKDEGRIERQLHSDNNIIFNLRDSPYNYKVSQE